MNVAIRMGPCRDYFCGPGEGEIVGEEDGGVRIFNSQGVSAAGFGAADG